MLFELFITVQLQIALLSRDIFPYYNLEIRNNYKTIKQENVLYYDFKLRCNTQEILLT